MAVATSVLDDAVAWIGVPLIVALTSFGLGLLAERVTRVRLPTVLLIPAGFCVAMAVVMPGYRLGAGGGLAAAIVGVGALAGFVLQRHWLRERLRPGPALAAALAVLCLYIAPVALTGGWTWGGYNFLNDTAVQMLLAEQLASNGAQEVQGAPSTFTKSVELYLGSSYPLGSHGHLATMATLLGTDVDVVYQGYLASLAMIAMLALTGLARRAGLRSWAAAAAAGVAVASNLLYQYALQGSLKEVAAFTALACTAAFGRELLSSERPLGSVALVGVAAAAMLGAISGAAGPYIVLIAAMLLLGAFLVPEARPLRRRLVPVTAIGAAVVALAALPTLISAVSFLRVATVTLSPASAATSTLGQLARPLEPIQLAGIWLTGNYSQPIAIPTLDAIARVLALLVFALLAIGLVQQLRRREPAVAIAVVAAVGTLLAVMPRASDYADGKLFALAAPMVLLGGMVAALGMRGRFRIAGLVAAGLVALGVVWSDAYAYHAVRIAPVEKMEALRDATDHTRGRGLVLFNELEEFAKYYGRDSEINVGFEAITVVHARPLGGGYHVDLDNLEPEFVQEFDTIVTRRGADVSRPPANFERAYGNAYYQVWEKRPDVRITGRHIPLQGPNVGAGVPACQSVRDAAAEAPPASWLVAAPAPDTLQLDVAGASDRPEGWGVPSAPPDIVQPATPGVVRGEDRALGGTYDVWIRGGTGRDTIARLDGREIGRAKGINTQGQWLHAGTVEVGAGKHELELERPGGGLAPGDGAIGELGPLALVRRESSALTWVRPRDARTLCGKRWDWVEVAQR